MENEKVECSETRNGECNMSTLPYLPGGQTELPAERHIVFAGDGNIIQKFDESEKRADGATFSASWQSADLNRSQPKTALTLNQVMISYSAERNTNIILEASVDGGINWNVSRSVSLVGTLDNQIRDTIVDLFVTGFDIRIRIRFELDELVNIFALHPVLVRRGPAQFSRTLI